MHKKGRRSVTPREPGKIYHVRNVTGGENLITSGRKNELAHTLYNRLYSFSYKSFMADRSAGTRWHYATLPGFMASYGTKRGNEIY